MCSAGTGLGEPAQAARDHSASAETHNLLMVAVFLAGDEFCVCVWDFDSRRHPAADGLDEKCKSGWRSCAEAELCVKHGQVERPRREEKGP